MKKLLSRPLFWIALAAAAFIALSTLSDPGAPLTPGADFGPPPGVTAEGVLSRSPNGFPEVTVTLCNGTEKELLSAGFYAVPKGADGKALTDWTVRNRFSTDASLKPGIEASFTFQSIQEGVAAMELYICSCIFSDGTRWGDPDAAPETAVTQGIPVKVTPLQK